MILNFWGWRPWRRGWGRGWRGGPPAITPAIAYPQQIPEEAIPLERVPTGTRARVVAVLAGMGAANRIFQMGIVPGTIVEVVENNLMYPWTPVLVRVHGMTVAIGRGLASKILVVPIHETSKSVQGGLGRGLPEEGEHQA